jgi:centrosomal protein CEP19
MTTFITQATNNKKKDLGLKKKNKIKNEELVDPDDYMPKRFGLKYDPPTIVLEYMVMSLGKLYHHKMKLIRLKPDSDVNEMIDYLYNRHSFYVKESVVSRQQLANLVIRLQKRMELQSNAQKTKENTRPTSAKKQSPEQKQPQKIEKPKGADTIPSSYLPSVVQKEAPKADDGWGNDDDWGLDDDWGENSNQEKDYDNYDLNKLSVEELKKEKAKMDVNFEKNQKKPDEDGFEYDVRKEFKQPKEE